MTKDCRTTLPTLNLFCSFVVCSQDSLEACFIPSVREVAHPCIRAWTPLLTTCSCCLQVFTTAQGRCLQLAKCLVQNNGVLLIAHPAEGQPLIDRLDKYILYNDEVMTYTLQSAKLHSSTS